MFWMVVYRSVHAQVPFFPPTQSLADFPEKVCKRLLLAAIGVQDLDVHILTVRNWTMHAEVAERFKVRYFLQPCNVRAIVIMLHWPPAYSKLKGCYCFS